MFYCSRNSKKHIFHYNTCRYTKHFSKKNRIDFYTVDEAKAAGYVPCSCCSIIGQQYRKCRREVMAFCAEHGFIHFMRDGELYVISARDTAWRICCNMKNGKEKTLLHESKEHVPYNRRARPYHERIYHVQKAKSTSIIGYLVYILKHDKIEEERDRERKHDKALLIEASKNNKTLHQQITQKQRKHKDRRPVDSYGGARRRANQQLRTLEMTSPDYWLDNAVYF